MAYTTTAIIREESPLKDTTNIADAYVTRAITQADSVIDGYIFDVYVLPLSSTPSLIQHISTTLAIYFLLTDQAINIEIASGVDATKLLEQATELLNQIKSRKLKLIVSGAELPTTSLLRPSSYPSASSTESGDTEPLFEIDTQY